MARRPLRTSAPRRAWPAVAVTAALVVSGCSAAVSTGGADATSSTTTSPAVSPSGSPSGSPSTTSPSTTSPSGTGPTDPAPSAPTTPTASGPGPDGSISTSPGSTTTGSTSPSPSTSTATPSPAPSTSAPTPPEPTPTAAPELLRRDDTGPQVQAVQERLAALGYWLGPADGTYGHLTQQAVLALQGAAGLDRDGVLGPATREALDAGTLPSVVTPSGHVVEIDRDAGLVVVADDGRPTTVLHTSTGTFERYTFEGRRYLADTPAGTFDVYRAVEGWHGGPLGDLYRPRYFQRDGIAVHGYPDVPAYPASHGCARVSLAAMDMIWADDLMAVGTPVVVR